MKELDIKGGAVTLRINPKVYPLDAIYSAAYVFLDRAYILLDGNPKKEVIVNLKSKQKEDLRKLGNEFFNELINYADYQRRAKETKKVREMIMQRALITNDSGIIRGKFDELMKDLEGEEDSDYLKDPEGIAIPWEEKYGKSVRKKK